jgi:polyisoprenoid-binding protein YceI
MLMKLFSLLFLIGSVVQAESWSPPATVNNDNVKVHFEVDSTWHLIHGQVPEVSGRIWLDNAGEPSSIRGELFAAVTGFDTDNKSRDKEMRHVMDAEEFPKVVLRVDGFSGEPCVPVKVEKSGGCAGFLAGEITIRDISQKLKIPFKIIAEGDYYKVNGDFYLKWEDFGVEDPSILVAKLDDTVHIFFQVLMNRVS